MTDTRFTLGLGALGSCLVGAGSFGIGQVVSPRAPLFVDLSYLLRGTEVGLLTSTLLVLAGLSLLFVSWRRIWPAVDLPTAKRAVWLWSGPLLLPPPIFSRDVYSYLAQGRLVANGFDPYRDWVSQLPNWYMQGSDGLWAESTAPYGPLALWMSGRLYELSVGSTELGVLLFRLLALGGVGLILHYLPLVAQAHRVEAGRAVLFVAANPLFLISTVSAAHNDALMVGALLAALHHGREGRRLRSVVWLFLSVSVKPITVLALPFVVLLWPGVGANMGSKVRAWSMGALGVLALLAVSGWITGWGFGWVRAMASQGAAAFPYAPWGVFGLFLGWLGGFLGVASETTAALVHRLGSCIALAIGARLALRSDAGTAVRSLGWTLLAAIAFAPIIQVWYLLWIMPLFVATKLVTERNHEGWGLAAFSGTALVTVEQQYRPQWVNGGMVSLTSAAMLLAAVSLAAWAVRQKVSPQPTGTTASGGCRR